MYMPIAKYVEKYGLNDFDSSFNAMYEITKEILLNMPFVLILKNTMKKPWTYCGNGYVMKTATLED